VRFKGLKAFISTSRDVKLLLLSGFFLGFGFSGFRLILNLYLKTLGYEKDLIGSFLSYREWAVMAMTIPAAFLIRKLRIKPVIIISMLMVGAGSLLVIYFPKTAYISAGMIIIGLFWAFSGVISGPMIMRDTSSENQPFLFSLNFTVGLTAGILGNLLAGALPDILRHYHFPEVEGYRISLLVHTVITVAAIVPFMYIKTKRVLDNHTERFFHVKTPWGRILLLAFPHVLVGLGAGLTVPFLNLHFNEVFKLSDTQLGLLFSTAHVLMIAGTLISPYIASRWGKIKTVIVFQLVSVPFLFLLSLQMNVWISIAAFLVRGALMNMSQPLVTNFCLQQTHKEDHPLMSGIMTVAWLAPWGVSANLGGRLIHKLGYFLPFNLTLAAYVLSSAAYFFFLLPMERKKTPPIH